MANLTDPARELADIVDRLSWGTNKNGQTVLSEACGFSAWSADFYRLILCILERAELVQEIVRDSAMDPDHKNQALGDIEAFKNAFDPGHLRKASNDASSSGAMIRDHGRAFRYLSVTVRAKISYPALTDEEITELLDKIDQYLGWLKSLQATANEFGREAIIRSLELFRFRLTKIGWLGSEFTLDGLRSVVEAYQAVKRDMPFVNEEMAEQALKGLGQIIGWVSTKVGEAKDFAEKGGFAWNKYKSISAIATPLLASGYLKLSGP